MSISSFSAEEIFKLRKDTPGTENVIHFNNAGASLMPQPVWGATQQFLEFELRNGGYEAALYFKNGLEQSYVSLAQLIEADSDEIAIVENNTFAWQQIFWSLELREGDIILTSQADYSTSLIAYLQIQKRRGVRLEVVPNDEHGQISVEHLERMINSRVKLISIVHVPTQTGMLSPAVEVGEIAKRNGIPYLLDACQSIGQLPVSVKQLNCDFLTGTSRKFLRGPRGQGFLYVQKKWLDTIEPFYLDLSGANMTGQDTYEMRKDARRFENFEGHMASKLALGVAVDYALHLGMERIWERIKYLGGTLREKLAEIEGVTVMDIGKVKGGIVTFAVEGKSPMDLRVQLKERDINVSVTWRESAWLDMEARDLNQLLRASLHYYNTETEIEQFCETLKKLR